MEYSLGFLAILLLFLVRWLNLTSGAWGGFVLYIVISKMCSFFIVELWFHAPQGILCNSPDDFLEIKVVAAGFLC